MPTAGQSAFFRRSTRIKLSSDNCYNACPNVRLMWRGASNAKQRKKMSTIQHKWALVTGSSRGIGRQIALGLAKRGCNVIVHAREAAHLEEVLASLAQYGVKTHAVEGDLATAQGVQSVIGGVAAGPNQVDILYNNAAIMIPPTSIYENTLEQWQLSFQVNLFAMVALCSAFAPAMKQRGYGRIINITSGIKDQPDLSPYSVSKAAVDKYSRDLSTELAGANVLVNYVDPGWLRTDLGGPDAMFGVETVVPGALVPALLEDNGPTGQLFAAQDFKYLA
jgi:NAD(P)-dependent dehydrogenase (short-subunit alcohol dehydrogenase family)